MKVPVVYAPDEMMKIMKQTQKQQICNYDTHYTFLLDVGLGHILGEYLSEGAAREWSTVVDISIPPPLVKHVSLSLSRSLLSKTPKQVFSNPINIFDSCTHSITVL